MIKCKKYLIVISENTKEKSIEKKFVIEKFKSWFSKWLYRPKIETAANVGIDNKNEILAESTLLKSKNLADVITIPDLLTPGIKASTCTIPMRIASL